MIRLAFAAVISLTFAAVYSISPLTAVAIAAVGAVVLTVAVTVLLRRAEQQEIAHVMEIIDACVAIEKSAAPVRLVS